MQSNVTAVRSPAIVLVIISGYLTPATFEAI
jgi:hypothetical protein